MYRPNLLSASILLAAPLLFPAAASAATFSVTSPAELTAAAKAARAGDTILLAPGSYGDLRLFRRKMVGGRVHITSANPASPATLSGINLEGAEGFLFTNLQIAGTKSPLVAITGNATNIAFHGNKFRGANVNQDPWDDENTGMYVRSATLVTLTANDFQDLRTALYVQNSFDVIIAQSSFSYLREGLNIASLGRGDIANNVFQNFSPNYLKREHPDAIQFWTRNETWGSHDISLRNNFFNLGGQRAVHGIFARSEEAESYGRPVYYERFTVTGNVYYGSALHGITLASMHGAKVSNNVVVASPWADTNNSNLRFADGRSSGGLQPQIRLKGEDIKAWGNVSMGNPPSTEGASSTDHIKIVDSKTKKGEPWTNVFAARPTADKPPLSAFLTTPGTVAATRKIGLAATFQAGTPAELGSGK